MSFPQQSRLLKTAFLFIHLFKTFLWSFIIIYRGNPRLSIHGLGELVPGSCCDGTVYINPILHFTISHSLVYLFECHISGLSSLTPLAHDTLQPFVQVFSTQERVYFGAFCPHWKPSIQRGTDTEWQLQRGLGHQENTGHRINYAGFIGAHKD